MHREEKRGLPRVYKIAGQKQEILFTTYAEVYSEGLPKHSERSNPGVLAISSALPRHLRRYRNAPTESRDTPDRAQALASPCARAFVDFHPLPHDGLGRRGIVRAHGGIFRNDIDRINLAVRPA